MKRVIVTVLSTAPFAIALRRFNPPMTSEPSQAVYEQHRQPWIRINVQ